MLAALALLLLTAPAVLAQDVPNPDARYEYIVVLEWDQNPFEYGPYFFDVIGETSPDRTTYITHYYEYALNGFAVMLTLDQIAKADRLIADRSMAGVQDISQSRELGIPALDAEAKANNTTSLVRNAEVLPTGIARIHAAAGDYGNVDVAVIDTGVDTKHPDLNVVGGVDCTVPRGQTQRWGVDDYGHGTHVAGTIGAKANGVGVVGVAPGARIWSVKVLDANGSGTWGTVLCGLDWVAEMSGTIDVANMSLGGPGTDTGCDGDDPMHRAICVVTESVIVVVAAGNSATNAAEFTPASYPEVVTVAAYSDFDGQGGGAGLAPNANCTALSIDDNRASFTNFGEPVDIYAPGVCILSTLPSTVNGSGERVPGYGYASGTSMASPHMAGAIARFLSENPDQREYAVEQVLTWAAANGEPVASDPNINDLFLLYIGAGVPRYEGSTGPGA